MYSNWTTYKMEKGPKVTAEKITASKHLITN